jgi:hypothetical protein
MTDTLADRFLAGTLRDSHRPLLAGYSGSLFGSWLQRGGRAPRVMPKVRHWMNTNSWLVNIIVYVIFIWLILG